MCHPAIVPIVAVFRDTHKGSVMLQMPFYPYGQVDEWVKSSAPGWMAVRAVLQDITGALAHLHMNQIVHSDIKPPNILVGPRERGKLADFDISVASETRTTQQYLVTTRVRVGWTANFEAPELPQTGSTAASDMFALGRTVAELLEACTDADGASSRGDVDEFVRVLTADSAEDRPSADAAAAHVFFKPLLAFRVEQASVCCIGAFCAGVVRHSDGAVCGEGHLTCRKCLEGFALSCAGEGLGLRREHEGRVCCPNSRGELGCTATPFSDGELGQILSASVFDGYVKGRMQVLESRVREAVEQEAERRLQAELRRLVEMDEAQRKVHPLSFIPRPVYNLQPNP